jgi:predicted kinase
MNDWVYLHLVALARSALAAGMPVIVDATFLEQTRRRGFAMLAKELNADFQILTCDAPIDVLRERIESRGSDPSEATIEVLRNQMKSHEPLTTDELQFVRPLTK